MQVRSFTSARPVPTGRSRCVRVKATTTFSGKLPKWDYIFDYLARQKQLRSIEPEEAEDMVKSGKAVIIDVRTPDNYKQSHPRGAVNVPLYQPLDWSKPDFGKVFKFIAYSSNGVNPVEPNLNFAEQLRQATGNGSKGAITVCEAGGTLKPSTNFPLGKPSRSLQAAFRAMSEGVCTDVYHMERGVYGWYQADLPFEGETEYKPDIGRTPNAAPEPTLRNIAASTGYAMREGDKKK